MPTAYLVMGCSGEYEDIVEWPVVVYATKARAVRHAKMAAEEAIRIRLKHPGDWLARRAAGRKSVYDPRTQFRDSEVGYHVISVELREELPGPTTEKMRRLSR